MIKTTEIKNSIKQETVIGEPKRLSKFGEWRKKHADGTGVIIHDMRAVLK